MLRVVLETYTGRFFVSFCDGFKTTAQHRIRGGSIMAKKMNDGTNTKSQNGNTKTRKKQAKQEAKLMLKQKQAEQDVQKAQQRFSRAQAALNDSTARLHELEQMISQLQTNRKISPKKAAQSAQTSQASNLDTSHTLAKEVDVSHEESTIADELHSSSSMPVEGRTDITEPPAEQETPVSIPLGKTMIPGENPQTPEAAGSPNGEVHADILITSMQDESNDLTIQSGEGSIPVIDNDARAWPPEPIREELAEAIEKEVSNEKVEQPSSTSQDENNDLTIQSGEGSIPIIDNDARAWPPEPIREELAEAIEKEVSNEKVEQTPFPSQDESNDLTIQSGGGSIPIIDNDARAWPPEPIREELAEAIKEETVTPQESVQDQPAHDQIENAPETPKHKEMEDANTQSNDKRTTNSHTRRMPSKRRNTTHQSPSNARKSPNNPESES
jgi:uncharacterized phage-associated protein